jgi:hypothetical protein
MNIHFQQAEKKSPVLFYTLIVLAVLTALMMVLNAGWHSDFRLSVPSSAGRVVLSESGSLPVAIAAPLPPAEQIPATTMPVASSTPSPLPQAVAVPVPDMP